MAYPIDKKLVIAVASSALFDLREPHAVFEKYGTEAYRRHQRERENDTLPPGVAFPFVKRLLRLNELIPEEEPVEVILLSRNDPDTGLRVFNSIETHELAISRGAFLSGGFPFKYIEAFNVSLFLSANPENVRQAILNGFPAGAVLESNFDDDPDDEELRVAFDFDGVVIDDVAETVYQEKGIQEFHVSEDGLAEESHDPGPLGQLLREIARLQSMERQREAQADAYTPLLRTAIVTSRNAPAHKRVVTTLREWGITVDETFFLGGMDKNRILAEFRPHIFFDDQLTHAGPAAQVAPSVHVPFGITNREGSRIETSGKNTGRANNNDSSECPVNDQSDSTG